MDFHVYETLRDAYESLSDSGTKLRALVRASDDTEIESDISPLISDAVGKIDGLIDFIVDVLRRNGSRWIDEL